VKSAQRLTGGNRHLWRAAVQNGGCLETLPARSVTPIETVKATVIVVGIYIGKNSLQLLDWIDAAPLCCDRGGRAGIGVRQQPRALRLEIPRFLAGPSDIASPRMARIIEGLAGLLATAR